MPETESHTACQTEPATLAASGRLDDGPEWQIYCGDALEVLQEFPDEKFNCVVTSPPYFWQRDYGVDGQIGLESSIQGYVNNIADTMDEVRRVLLRNGVLFLNLGDTYYSKKGKPRGNDKKNWARRFGGVRLVDTTLLPYSRKTLLGMPWRVVLEMVERGWVLRSQIIWCRKYVQPEPTARDRPWRSYEALMMFSKSPVYYFDRSGLKKSQEDIWTIHSQSRGTDRKQSAYFPDELVARCLRVACPDEGWVLDPFAGSGTVLRVALRRGHNVAGIDISPESFKAMEQEVRSGSCEK